MNWNMPDRRRFIALSVSLVSSVSLAACQSITSSPPHMDAPHPVDPDAPGYSELSGEKHPVSAVKSADLDPQHRRQIVEYATSEPPGTLVVDTRERFLYLILQNGEALRYGVGVGREGLEFKGSANIALKREWPHWTPTPDMIKRDPDRYAKWAGGMEGGPRNPLGARALYLFKNGKDTLFRIHGTTEPWTIGKAVSSGCIRMVNQDVIDIYSRIPVGSKVVVL